MIDPHTLRRLRRLLASGRQVDVRLAADLLAASGDAEAFDVLRRALEHGDEQVRSAVVQALGYHHDKPEALEMLRRAVERERDAAVRTELVGALATAGQVEIVADLLRNDADAEVRLQAAVALGRTLPSDERVLIAALESDPDVRVRAAAAESLGWVGTEAALKPLLITLQAREHEVRVEAVYALGRMADPRAAEALLDLADADPDEEVGRAALWALVEIAYAAKDATLLERARAIDPEAVFHFEQRRKRHVEAIRER